MLKATLVACVALLVGLSAVTSELQGIKLPSLGREQAIQLIEEVQEADEQLEASLAEGAKPAPVPVEDQEIEEDDEFDLEPVERDGEITTGGAEESDTKVWPPEPVDEDKVEPVEPVEPVESKEPEDGSKVVLADGPIGDWPQSSRLDFTYGAYNKLNLVRFFHGTYYHRMYNRINNYLVDATNSSAFDVNMRLANEWLQRELDRGVNIFKNEATVDALKQFTALHTIEGRCDQYSYAILFRNDKATNGEAYKRASKMSQTPRRIVALVHYESLRHSIECHLVYPDSYGRIRASADQSTLVRVETFLNALINDHLASKKDLASLFNRQLNVSIDPGRVVSGIKSISGKKAAQLAYETIKGYSWKDENRVYLRKVVDEKKGKRVVNQEKVRDLVRVYLVEPCKYYLETFGPDVYIPAMYEAKMLEPEDRYNSLTGELLDGFVYGWIRYRLCESLVNKDQNRLAKGVISLINKLPDQQ